MPRIGGLFEGYGGLTMGVQSVLGGELAWYADCCKFDKHGNAGHYEPHRSPCSILEHHNPGMPNLGDVSKVDWSQVEPVDILTGGSPCQDLSHAGKRAGMTEGTRSNLWVAMREAIAQLRPGLVVWENVRGAYSAEADSDLGSDPRLLADTRRRAGEPVLRALGRVLGDLADLGYDAGWHGLRAADVGAPHGRMRVFLVAYSAGDAGRFGYGDGGATADRDDPRPGSAGREGRGRTRAQHGVGGGEPSPALMPTPRATDGTKGGPNQRGSSGDLMLPSAVALLPTPAVNDMGAAYTPDEWDAWTDRMKTEHGNGNGHGKSLSIEAQRLLLPTPKATNNENRQTADRYGANLGQVLGITDASGMLFPEGGGPLTPGSQEWGVYEPAIRRWEHTLGRPAPEPTQLSTKGNPQLSARFVEWLMGLPAGWVTDTPGITRNEALKALGNGVVPQQAEAALRVLLPAIEAAA